MESQFCRFKLSRLLGLRTGIDLRTFIFLERVRERAVLGLVLDCDSTLVLRFEKESFVERVSGDTLFRLT